MSLTAAEQDAVEAWLQEREPQRLAPDELAWPVVEVEPDEERTAENMAFREKAKGRVWGGTADPAWLVGGGRRLG